MSVGVAFLVAVTGCLGHPSSSAAPASSAPASSTAAASTTPSAAAATTAAPAGGAPAPASASAAPASATAAQTVVPADSAAPDQAVPLGASTAPAAAALARMSLAQRVGQLFMVGTPATEVSPVTLRAIQADHVGNVILTGRSTAGLARTTDVTTRLQRLASVAATAGVPLFVATDQEGGLVQVLRGPGFSTIPSALTQGTWSVASVTSYAKKWGGQLKGAGVNVDLGPVLDTVPSPAAALHNPPIGRFHREYGFTPALVSSRGGAFAAGLALAKVDATVKHFPGLGRVTGNTDTTAGVTDSVTHRGDPYLMPFAAAVTAGAPFVMMSTAIYSRLDPGMPAAFSITIISKILRGDLGFRGVVISDDLGNAKQVAAWTVGNRAINFLKAGGDMVLTVNPAVLQPMYAAVLALAQKSPAFRAQVNASALRVLVGKQRLGLLSAP
jgi:beta-N-acetylhexosaminidase